MILCVLCQIFPALFTQGTCAAVVLRRSIDPRPLREGDKQECEGLVPVAQARESPSLAAGKCKRDADERGKSCQGYECVERAPRGPNLCESEDEHHSKLQGEAFEDVLRARTGRLIEQSAPLTASDSPNSVIVRIVDQYGRRRLGARFYGCVTCKRQLERVLAFDYESLTNELSLTTSCNLGVAEIVKYLVASKRVTSLRVEFREHGQDGLRVTPQSDRSSHSLGLLIPKRSTNCHASASFWEVGLGTTILGYIDRGSGRLLSAIQIHSSFDPASPTCARVPGASWSAFCALADRDTP